jgi:hypothetical protein
MAVTNLLKQQVDQPVFEWMRFAPTATSATSALTSRDDKSGRFLYYLNAQALWKYDTYSDSWQEAAPTNTTSTAFTTTKYQQYNGNRGHVITATSNTITVGYIGRNVTTGTKIRIIAGKGAGQERTISSVAAPVVADFGVLNSVSGVLSLGDTSKKWQINQWDGYTCRIVFGTGLSQFRKIQYNSQTTLSFSDTNWQAIDSWNNTGWSSVSPYAAPVTTSALQGHYQIESQVITVDSSWTVTPDGSSIYMIMEGGLWFLSNATSTPFATWQWYDSLTDAWVNKTPPSGHLTSGIGTPGQTDIIIERIGEVGGATAGSNGAFVSGLTATAGASYTLTNSGVTMDRDRYANYELRITSGTGVGQKRRIVANSATAFYVNKKWDITPDNTSVYSVFGNTNHLWVSLGVSNGSSALLGYGVEEDIWYSGHLTDYGIARNITATPSGGAGYGPSHEGIAITSIVRTTSGILSGAVNAAGSNYVVGDLVTCSTTGTNGTFFVTAVNSTGGVTALELAASGSGYSNGSSSTTGGSGSGLTITLTVGTTALVTTAINHDFRPPVAGTAQESVTIAGCATDTSFNATFSIIGVGSLTTFSIAAPSSSASPTAASSQSTTLFVDAAKNWDTNELVGKILVIWTSGITPTIQSRKISANTATTISFSSGAITAATNGTSRYAIQEPRAFGTMISNKIETKSPLGWATSGTATTLVDTTKNWLNNQWINCRVRIVSGTGTGNESVITANSATTLTVASWGVATPDATSKYEILDTYGIVTTGGTISSITDANKNWTTDILAGKRLRIIAGTGMGTEVTVSQNTATVLSLASTITTDTTSYYAIYEPPIRSSGNGLIYPYNLTDSTKKGRWLISFRGGASAQIDIYDIPSNTWSITEYFQPQTTTFTTGSMFAYDGADSIIMNKDATSRLYELNLSTFEVYPSAITPYAHGTAIYGNRMEIVSTTDGLKYLYVMRHSGQEMWRTLKFW